MSKNQPVPAAPTALALPFDYGQDAGRGLDLTLDDLLVPFLGLLQKDSAELDPDEEKYIEGAAEGMLLNKASKQLYDGESGILIVPALRRRSFVEFLPDRGGFVADHETNSQVVRDALASGAKRSELTTKNGNVLTETYSIFAITLDEQLNPTGYVVIPFSSSKIAVWRGYWTKIDTCLVTVNGTRKKLSQAATIFSLLIRLGSKFQKNDKGKFFNFTLAPAKGGVLESLIPADHPAYIAAKSLEEAVLAGRAQADYTTADTAKDPIF